MPSPYYNITMLHYSAMSKNVKKKLYKRLPIMKITDYNGSFHFFLGDFCSVLKFGLRPKISQKVKSLFVWSDSLSNSRSDSLRPNFGLSNR